MVPMFRDSGRIGELRDIVEGPILERPSGREIGAVLADTDGAWGPSGGLDV